MASIAERLGMKVAARDGARTGLKALGMAGLVGGAGVAGLIKGIGSGTNGVQDAFYEMTTGNPNIDQDVFGTDMSWRQMVVPFPGEYTRQAMLHGGVGPDILYQLKSGLINSKTTGDFTMKSYQGFGDYNSRYQSFRNPTVDGSIVFGQYNSRFG